VAWDLKERRIRFANEAFERLLGAPYGVLTGQAVESLLKVPASQWEAIEASLSGGGQPAELAIGCARADGSVMRVAGVVSRLPVGSQAFGLLTAGAAGGPRCAGPEALQIAARERTRMDVEAAIERVNQAIESVHDLARGLPPAGGLPAMLEQLAWRASERTGVQVDLKTDIQAPTSLTTCAAIHLYRIVQEALSNVIRHSRATLAMITLKVQDGSLMLCVEDNGRGLPPGALEGDGPGFTMMRHRAQALSSRLSIESGATGTRIRVTCPPQPH
jgi:two-component sensor histidine kinase